MKATLITVICGLFVAALACGGQPEKLPWQNLKPDALQAHVQKVKSFKDVKELLGKPAATDSDGIQSKYAYKINRSYRLVFVGESRNDFRRNDDERSVHSVWLFQFSDDGHKVFWKFFVEVEEKDEIRSDHFSIPKN